MKIYLATTAPGNEQWREGGMMNISRRLLSFFHILKNQFECREVLAAIIKENRNANDRP
jgi:hypothetical protein